MIFFRDPSAKLMPRVNLTGRYIDLVRDEF